MNVSLSELDIKDFFNNDCLIIKYNDLKDYTDLDSILDLIPRIFLLYEYKPNYGHWVLILKTVNNKKEPVIEFFDSYGTPPDLQLNTIPKELRNIYGMEYPLVLPLLIGSKFPIEYNNYKLQKKNKKITTCGRWCVMRAFLDQLNIDEFSKIFMNKKNSSDSLVTSIHQLYSDI